MSKNKMTAKDLANLSESGKANNIVPANMRTAQMEKSVGQATKVGGGVYTGAGDPTLENEGAKIGALIDDVNEGKIYTLQLTNSSSEIKEVILSPGLLFGQGVEGVIKDGPFRGRGDAIGDPTVLTASGAPGRIADLLGFIHNNPTIVSGFRIRSTSPLQNSLNVYMQPQNPFKQSTEAEHIPLGAYSNEYAEQVNVITVNRGFILDNETRISIEVAANSSMSIILFSGSSQNMSRYFKKKVMEATAYTEKVGRGTVRQQVMR
jgi:hypothetical protein